MSMFHVEKRSRNTLIINTIITYATLLSCPSIAVYGKERKTEGRKEEENTGKNSLAQLCYRV